MNIKQLHNKINKQREHSGLPPISEVEFTEQITVIQLNGKIKIKDGEVEPAAEKGEK